MKIRCSICGETVNAHKVVEEHKIRSGLVKCYGSHMPIFETVFGPITGMNRPKQFVQGPIMYIGPQRNSLSFEELMFQ